MAARRLVVNADDYGLTEAVSRGILRAHHEGIVTSTSVLAVAPAFERTATWLRDEPALGVGVHLCAVGEDPPLTPVSRVRSLVDREGRFPTTWRSFFAKAALGLVRTSELETELSAQIERVREEGIRITHLDSHQHLHLWPSFREVALRLAKRFGIPAIRVPRSHGRRGPGPAVNVLAWRLAGRAKAAGIRFPDTAAGFDEAGRIDLELLLGTLETLANDGAPSAELGVHPGEASDPDRGRYAWDYRWGEELAALTDPRAKEAVERLGFELATFDAV